MVHMEIASKHMGREDWSSEENRDEDTDLGAVCVCVCACVCACVRVHARTCVLW